MKKQFLVMALADIIPYENNPRINDEAVADVVESIKNYGFKVPLVMIAWLMR